MHRSVFDLLRAHHLAERRYRAVFCPAVKVHALDTQVLTGPRPPLVKHPLSEWLPRLRAVCGLVMPKKMQIRQTARHRLQGLDVFIEQWDHLRPFLFW
ncbi:hypothetical protein B2D07_19710 [Desulfococcus multivorans]|nr:hypothetical protein B2D07_19710 [Desulfococcus multivorans]